MQTGYTVNYHAKYFPGYHRCVSVKPKRHEMSEMLLPAIDGSRFLTSWFHGLIASLAYLAHLVVILNFPLLRSMSFLHAGEIRHLRVSVILTGCYLCIT